MKVIYNFDETTQDQNSEYLAPYGLIINKEYLVMAILFTNDNTSYLKDSAIHYLVDENGRPDFYPSNIFKLSCSKIDSKWNFSIKKSDLNGEGFRARTLLGYYEICYDAEHFDQIILGEQNGIELYYKRKKESIKNLEWLDFI